jgi:chromate transporter
MAMLWDLFVTFLTIGSTAFGGGYAVMPLITRYVVEERQWITIVELADVTSISQMTPGPIILNSATFVGVKMAGFMGGVVATLGSVLPSFILILILGYYFFKHSDLAFIQAILSGLRPAIVGLILIASLALIQTSLFNGAWPGMEGSSFNVVAILTFLVGLLISSKTKVDTLGIVTIGGLIGLASYFIF